MGQRRGDTDTHTHTAGSGDISPGVFHRAFRVSLLLVCFVDAHVRGPGHRLLLQHNANRPPDMTSAIKHTGELLGRTCVDQAFALDLVHFASALFRCVSLGPPALAWTGALLIVFTGHFASALFCCASQGRTFLDPALTLEGDFPGAFRVSLVSWCFAGAHVHEGQGLTTRVARSHVDVGCAPPVFGRHRRQTTHGHRSSTFSHEVPSREEFTLFHFRQ